jgi:hypothetical protein
VRAGESRIVQQALEVVLQRQEIRIDGLRRRGFSLSRRSAHRLGLLSDGLRDGERREGGDQQGDQK